MTQQKDLKRRIRERMEKTGESYTTARAHVLAERTQTTVVPPAVTPLADALSSPPGPRIAVVEPVDVTEVAVELGMKCKVLVNDGIDARGALGKLLEVLARTEDVDLMPFRLVAIVGRRPVPARWSIVEMRTFVARARGDRRRRPERLAARVSQRRHHRARDGLDLARWHADDLPAASRYGRGRRGRAQCNPLALTERPVVYPPPCAPP